MKIFRTQLILIFLSVIVFLFVIRNYNGPEKDTIAMVFILQLPFITLGLISNAFIIKIFEKFNQKIRVFNYIFPVILLVLSYIINIKWISEIEINDFYCVIGVLLISNLLGYFLIKD